MSTTLKVLLVEDDPEVLLGTKQALELAGFEIEPFTDAETAATRIVPDVPAIVVCDVNLPGMDGLSLLSHARSVDNDLAVTASKPNLIELVKKCQLRQDLFYRLNVVVIDLPPLCERKEDIPLLFEHFVLDAARRHQRPAPVVRERQLIEFLSHDWPGNVRELRNVAERFVLGLLDDSVGIRSGPAVKKVSLSEQIDRFEQVLIEDALSEHRGNTELASRSLGIPKRTLYDKIRKFGLSTDAFRSVRGGQQ